MDMPKRFLTYLNERSPLPAISFVSIGITLSCMAMRGNFDWCLFVLGLLLNNLLFIQMRLGDELKDYETDKVINPTRPLPRGLFTVPELKSILHIFLGILVLSSLLVGYFKSPLAGGSLLLAILFAWLMYKEFYIPHQLDKNPLFNAITHQVIVFPIFAWVGFAADSSLIYDRVFQGWLLANFGVSFTFEICRKLDPKAHALAKTYAHHYGRPLTVFICSVFMSLTAIGAYWGGFFPYSLAALALVFVGLVIWMKSPEKYKLPAGLSVLSSTIALWAPAIIWLIHSWRST